MSQRGQGNRGGSSARGRGGFNAPRGRGGPSGGGAGRGGGDFRGGPPRGGGFGGTRARGGPPQIYSAGVPPRIDARIAASEKAVVEYAKVPYDPRHPLRPGFGTLGTPVTLRANFFALKLPKKPIFEYKVEIQPPIQKQAEKSRLFALVEETPVFQPLLGHIAHDRSERLVSAKELPQPLSATVKFVEEGMQAPGERAKTYTMTVVYATTLKTDELDEYLNGNPEHRNYDALPLISALNLVLQQHAVRTGYRMGKNRHFFDPDSNESRPVAFGVEAWKGFYSSVRPVFGQLTVNLNVCMSAFYVPGNLADAMLAFQRQSKGGLPFRFVQKLKVRTLHLGYKKDVKRITSTSARKTKFYDSEVKKEVTVEEYFKRKYPHIRLQHADTLPVVDVGAKKPTYIPAELCEITPGTPYMGRLDGRETAQMIRYACNPPAVNATSIVEEGFPKLGLNPVGARSPLAGFGITVSSDMADIPARVLPPPSLAYKSGKATIKDGGWNLNEVKFFRGASLSPSWAVLVVRDGGRDVFTGQSDQNLTGLVTGFADKLRAVGMTVPQTAPSMLWTEMLPPQSQDPNRRRALSMIEGAIKKNLNPKSKPSFILVLLSLEDNYIYPGIKRLCDIVLGLQTVCMIVNDKKALVPDPKKRDQYYSNVALKVNAKLGGLNHVLDANAMKWLREKKTMMVGCDVTHPGPTSVPGTPSVAAVVASIDDNFVQFPASLRLQSFTKDKASKEMIDDMSDMMVERLLLYKKINKSLPERVYIFRDGVSEGQFDLVLKEELPLVRAAFKKVYGTQAEPKLTILICGKRHHARPIPTSLETASNNGNTKPGTVVDKGITDVYRYDFYLQAHSGLQGTVRPTHYTIVYDENRLSADTIQQGANTASHLYARATKAVSLIPPAYYADIACERARFYINDFLNLADDRTSSSGAQLSKEEERKHNYDQAKQIWGKGVHESLRETMFYI